MHESDSDYMYYRSLLYRSFVHIFKSQVKFLLRLATPKMNIFMPMYFIDIEPGYAEAYL